MNDLISRQAAIDAIMSEIADDVDCRSNVEHWWWNLGMDRAAVILKQLPSVQEPKSGKWIPENRRPKSMMFYCSECKRTAYDPQNHYGNRPKRCRYAFCPNCGAKMED